MYINYNNDTVMVCEHLDLISWWVTHTTTDEALFLCECVYEEWAFHRISQTLDETKQAELDDLLTQEKTEENLILVKELSANLFIKTKSQLLSTPL